MLTIMCLGVRSLRLKGRARAYEWTLSIATGVVINRDDDDYGEDLKRNQIHDE